MKRRDFLKGILATGIAPAIVKAAHLMPVKRLESGIAIPNTTWEPAVTSGFAQVWDQWAGPYRTYLYLTEYNYGTGKTKVREIEYGNGVISGLSPDSKFDLKISNPWIEP